METETGISFLIAADPLWKLTAEEVLELVRTNTALGWTVRGPSCQSASFDGNTNHVVSALRVETISDDDTISQILQSIRNLKSADITDSGKCTFMSAGVQKMIRDENGKNTAELF